MTPPRLAVRTVLLALLCLVLAVCSWSLIARLDIVATAPGKLIPQSQVKIVQAPETGIVRELLVSEGERVRARDVLLRLDPTLAMAENAQVTSELALKRLVVRAIDSELAGQPFVVARGEQRAIFDQVSAQFVARRQSTEDALAQERAAATRARHERIAAERQLEKLRATLPAYQQAAESFARLLADGFIGELAANEKRREAIEREQDLRAQEATLDALAAVLVQSERRQEQLKSNFRAELLRERGEAQASVRRLEQESAKAGFRSRVLEVLAPQAGVVKDLVVRAPGFVVQPGSVLLRVVPDGDPLVAEALLANEDVGFVEVGQLARIKLVAYPFQKYGVIEGRVVQISADANDAGEPQRIAGGAVPQAYRALIELAAQQLVTPGGRALELTAGMATMVEIHQGRRTVMEYLLSPVQRVTAEAGRER